MLVGTAWYESTFLWFSRFCFLSSNGEKDNSGKYFLAFGIKQASVSFSYRPAILYPHRHWIINGEKRTNNQERVLGSPCLKFMVLHNIEHVQFTCQELSDSYSRVPFSYFDLIQHLAGWWSMSEDGDLLFIPLNFGIWLWYHASYIFIYIWSYQLVICSL